MQFYFSLLLAFVKRMHAHVRRNLGFDSTFWGLGVLTSVVWQYTFHFESLHFQFFWTLRRFATACDWCRLQCGDWTKLHSETWLLPPLTPHHTSHPAVAMLCFACLCLLWSLDSLGLFFYFCQIRQNKDHWVALWCPSSWWWIWWGDDGKNHGEKWRWLKLKLKVIINSIKIW